ncbi:MAG: elongation factor Ts [Chitinivibrionales bacterium]|nr:elongation factor Ts [Chitinivibrionales bacterium]
MAITATQVKELRERTGLGMMLCKKALEETGGDMDQAIENLRKQGEATLAKRAGKETKEGTISIVVSDSVAVMYEVNSETDFVARNEDFVAFVSALGELLLAKQPSDMDAAMKLSAESMNAETVEKRLLELTGKIGERITFRRFHIEKAGDNERVYSYVHGAGRIGVLVKLSSDKPDALASDAAAALGKDLAMQVAAANPIAASREAIPEDAAVKEREIYLTQAQNSGKPEKIWDRIVEGKMAKFYEQVVLVEQAFIKEPDISVTERMKQAAKEAGAELSAVSFVRYELGSD